jgi:hypothetical protein
VHDADDRLDAQVLEPKAHAFARSLGRQPTAPVALGQQVADFGLVRLGQVLQPGPAYQRRILSRIRGIQLRIRSGIRNTNRPPAIAALCPVVELELDQALDPSPGGRVGAGKVTKHLPLAHYVVQRIDVVLAERAQRQLRGGAGWNARFW